MNRKVLAQLRAYEMLSPGDHVVIAVSGGMDSMALLHVLLELSPQLDITVSAAHLDHQLRGAESHRDAAFVRSHCEALGVPCTIKTADVPAYAARYHLGDEEAARLLRYEFLDSLDPDAKIATAHTADDNLETVLMHLLRGSGLRGLTGIPPVRGRIIRPLLSVTRREIEDYLNEHQIPHVEDSSNGEDAYLRNRLRHRVIPLLTEENPAVAPSVLRMAQSLRQDADFLDREARSRLALALEEDRLSIPLLLREPEAMQYRMLQLFLAPAGELSRRHLDSALALCRGDSPSGSVDLPGGYRLSRAYDTLLLTAKTSPSPQPTPVMVPGPGTYAFGPWTVTCIRGPAPSRCPEGTVALSLARLSLPLCLRPPGEGDRIRLSGGTKKLSRLYIDQKIPASLRSGLPVVWAGDAIAAALPIRAARDFLPSPGEDSLMFCAVKKECSP